MQSERLGLLPFRDLDDQQFEAFVLSFFSAGISLAVIEPAPLEPQSAPRAARHQIISATLYGSPGRGGQRGIDIQATTDTGALWAIQCKHYTARFTDAKARSAMDEATAKFPRADRYFLILSGEPGPQVRTTVESYPRSEVWGGSELSQRFFNEVTPRKQIEIVQRIFPEKAAELIKRLFPLHDDLLVPADRFFQTSKNASRIFHHRAELVGRRELLDQLHRLIADPATQAVVLTAPGGFGKTRLLRALGDEFSPNHPTQKLYFVDDRAAPDAASHILRIAGNGELVVVQDDAHRLETLRADVIASVAEKHGKVVLACRPHAIEALRAWLGRQGIEPARTSVVRVPSLTPPDRIALASECLPTVDRRWAEDLASAAGPCALIITVGAELIRQKQLAPQALTTSPEFRAELFARFEAESFARAVLPEREPLARDLLRLVAITAPWTERVLSIDGAKDILACTEREFQETFDALRAAQLLVQTRDGWRVVPDLFADNLVYRACYDDAGKVTAFARKVQAAIGASATESVIRNLAEAEWEAELNDKRVESLLEPFWSSVEMGFATASYYQRARTIEIWAHVSVLQPERSLTLARMALDLKSAPPLPEPLRSNTLSLAPPGREHMLSAVTDLLEPIAIYHDKYRVRALDLLWEIYEQDLTRDESGKSALASLGKAATFQYRGLVETAEQVVSWLERKLRSPDAAQFCDTMSPVLAVILKPVFDHDIEDSSMEGDTLHLRSYPVSVENTRSVRTAALRILRELVIPRGEIPALNALGVLEAAVGPVRYRFTSAIDEAIEKAWLAERRAALAVIAGMVHPEQSPLALFRIRGLLRPLAHREAQPEFRVDCQRVLASVPDSAELNLARVLLSSGWAEFFHDAPLEELDVKEAEPKIAANWQTLTDAVARTIIEQHNTPTALLSYLDQVIGAYQNAGLSPTCWSLLSSIPRQAPDLAADTIDLLLGQPTSQIDPWWTALFIGVRTFPDERLLGWTSLVLSQNNPARWRALLGILSWANVAPQADRLIPHVATWATRLDDATLDPVLNALRWGREQLGKLHDIVLENLPLERLSSESLMRLAQSLSTIVALKQDPVSPRFMRRFIAELMRVDILDDRTANPFLQSLADAEPEDFFRMLVARIEVATHRRAAKHRFSPLPLFDGFPLRELPKRPNYEGLAHEAFQRVQAIDRDTRIYWRTLFQDAVLRVSPVGLKFLKAWLPTIECSEHLLELVQTLKFPGSMIIFRDPEFVRTILGRTRQIAPAEYEKISRYLARTAAPAVRGYTNHALDPEYRYYRDEAAKAAEVHRGDFELEGFYRSIVREEDADTARQRREAELQATQWS